MTTIDPALAAGSLGDLTSVAPEVELVVLFGSTVVGRARRGSDVDIAVRCDAVGELDRLHAILAPRLGAGHLDLTDLRRAGTILAFQSPAMDASSTSVPRARSGSSGPWRHAVTGTRPSFARRGSEPSTSRSGGGAWREPGRRRGRQA